MAVRHVPRRTRVKMELFKGFTMDDVLWLVMCVGVFGLFILADSFAWRWAVGGVVAGFLAVLIVKNNGVRMYSVLGYGFAFFAYKKTYYKDGTNPAAKHNNVKELIPYVGLIDNETIDYKEYYAKVIAIEPFEFGLMSEYKQDQMINAFANAFRRLSHEQSASLVKITKPMLLDGYYVEEERKWGEVMKNYQRKMYADKELHGRKTVFESRAALLDYLNEEDKIFKDFFYFVIYSKERNLLNSTAEGCVSAMRASNPPMRAKIVQRNELISFLRANYTKNYDEREIKNLKQEEVLNWIMPNKVKFGTSNFEVDGEKYANFTISDYPMAFGNAWGYNFFGLKDTRVVMNFQPIPTGRAVAMVDKAIIEMETQLRYSGKSSVQLEKQTALESMHSLLRDLKNDNEGLFNTQIHLCCEMARKKEVRARIREMGFSYNEMFCRQVDAFVSANVSAKEKTMSLSRGLQTSTLAGVFPFISSALHDENGFYLGYNQYPVFVNFFKRDNERVNSNMIVIGRSGSGKSFATKTIISNLVADDCKIFILDPENEYEIITKNMGGKIIDVGNGIKERFNPFNVIAGLEDEDGSASGDNLATHLQFLEEFFKLVLDGITTDALELLNSMIVELYKRFNITSRTDFSKLGPSNYPIFDDLYKIVQERHDMEKDEYQIHNLKIVLNYIAKFSSGGRMSNLWNGYTNIESHENFIVFGFRSLLANRNMSVAGAQMLLTFKFLDNEVIKNREYNLRYHTGERDDYKCRKIIIVVDEAHTFINPKFPIALDFMFQMAKRIRKYKGMQIVITQNILDFMGSEEMIRQSSAIIAASQYSLIMSLSPNDVTELVKLYKNAGGINETEQEQITNAGRGEGFFITGSSSRTSVQIEVMPDVRKLFDD